MFTGLCFTKRQTLTDIQEILMKKSCTPRMGKEDGGEKGQEIQRKCAENCHYVYKIY